MNLKPTLFNGTIGLTTIFTTILNIREVLDMLFNHVIQFILIVLLSLFILFLTNFILARFSGKGGNISLDSFESKINDSRSTKPFINLNNWIQSTLITAGIIIFIASSVGLYFFKTSPVYYVVLTDEGLSQKECLQIKTEIEFAENSDKINLKNHSIHLSTTNQLFLKPAYFTTSYYLEAEKLINEELKKLNIKAIHVHKSNPFFPGLKRKLQYLNF